MRVSMICLWVAILSGCSTAPNDEAMANKQMMRNVVPATQQNSVHYYTQRIANQLFRSRFPLKSNAGIAIGTFTQIDSLLLNDIENHPLRLLGLQLEEGLITASINQGLKVIEFKTRANLTIKSDQDLMLSRDVSKLKASANIKYFLTGTLTEQENGVVVNARLINIANNQVMAAATDYVPMDTLWSTSKVKLKQNSIYRTGY
jgi:TolB-like protein